MQRSMLEILAPWYIAGGLTLPEIRNQLRERDYVAKGATMAKALSALLAYSEPLVKWDVESCRMCCTERAPDVIGHRNKPAPAQSSNVPVPALQGLQFDVDTLRIISGGKAVLHRTVGGELIIVSYQPGRIDGDPKYSNPRVVSYQEAVDFIKGISLRDPVQYLALHGITPDARAGDEAANVVKVKQEAVHAVDMVSVFCSRYKWFTQSILSTLEYWQRDVMPSEDELRELIDGLALFQAELDEDLKFAHKSVVETYEAARQLGATEARPLAAAA